MDKILNLQMYVYVGFIHNYSKYWEWDRRSEWRTSKHLRISKKQATNQPNINVSQWLLPFHYACFVHWCVCVQEARVLFRSRPCVLTGVFMLSVHPCRWMQSV